MLNLKNNENVVVFDEICKKAKIQIKFHKNPHRLNAKIALFGLWSRPHVIYAKPVTY